MPNARLSPTAPARRAGGPSRPRAPRDQSSAGPRLRRTRAPAASRRSPTTIMGQAGRGAVPPAPVSTPPAGGGLTVVVSVAVLLDSSGSSVDEATDAWFVIVPVSFGVTTTVTRSEERRVGKE